MWQDLRKELHPKGLEIVTVALDVNVEAARVIIEQVNPKHPSLIDERHSLDALFGVVNVPSGVWIDERGMIVRPPEPAFPRESPYRDAPVPESLPERIRDMLLEARHIRTESLKYIAAVRDWVDQGSESAYALTPDEVLARSRPRPVAESQAAAYFELGEHLYAAGEADRAARNWREAHRLQPDNWTYKRQAWSLADPTQGPTELYEGDWLSDVREIGAENYYPPLEM